MKGMCNRAAVGKASCLVLFAWTFFYPDLSRAPAGNPPTAVTLATPPLSAIGPLNPARCGAPSHVDSGKSDSTVVFSYVNDPIAAMCHY